MNDDFLQAQADYHQALAEQLASTEKMHQAKVRMMALDRRKRSMFDATDQPKPMLADYVVPGPPAQFTDQGEGR